MPRFNPDPTKATGAPIQLTKDTYTFEIGEASPFQFDKDPTKISYGVQYKLTVVSEGPFKGKSIFARLFQHTDGAQDMAKKFLLAAAGLNPNKPESDTQWNEAYGAKDFSFSIEGQNKSVGDGWNTWKGQMIVADADLKPSEKDASQMNQQLNFKPYLPN